MKLKEPTNICKICFNEIKISNLHSFLCKNSIFCENCLNKLEPIFIKYKEENVNCLSLYYYDEVMQNYLYQFKGCYDYEIKTIFLERWAKELSIIYSGYYIVPIPSYYLENEKRGFNHVIEIFSLLNLPFIYALEKTGDYKQSSQRQSSRNEIINYLKLSNVESIKNKRILIVDDVYTTGSTIRASIKLLEQCHPKKISVLTISKTRYEEDATKVIGNNVY